MPSNTGAHVGRQWETRPPEGGHAIQQRHTSGRGGKKGDKRGDNRQGETIDGRQWGPRSQEGGRTIRHRHTYKETMVIHVRRQWEPIGDKGTQDPPEGGHTTHMKVY